MKIHILGICGTFMGSIAILAKELGHEVSGCDANVYPPMSTQLEEHGIDLLEGYHPTNLQPHPELVIVGNAMSRENPCVEYMLDQGLRYISGPQWLSENVLKDRWVLAVAGTHGKTTTSTMLAWILEYAQFDPGFLIGGIPINFSESARLGSKPFFVIEADEYDTAFFDKRSKFVHYHPRTLILNNLEFDHADIFTSISDIQKQFHHLLRIVPSLGRVISPIEDTYLEEVLEQGCWSEHQRISLQDTNCQWYAKLAVPDGSSFDLFFQQTQQGSVKWSQTGVHNVSNALSAIAAAQHIGITPQLSIEALNQFSGVKRRLEIIFENPTLKIYDDFAHHPTAITATLNGLREKVGAEKIIAIIEPRSNTMRMGVHREQLPLCTSDADLAIWYQPANVDWNLQPVFAQTECTIVIDSIESIVNEIVNHPFLHQQGITHIVVMSNGDFGGIHSKLAERLGNPNGVNDV